MKTAKSKKISVSKTVRKKKSPAVKKLKILPLKQLRAW